MSWAASREEKEPQRCLEDDLEASGGAAPSSWGVVLGVLDSWVQGADHGDALEVVAQQLDLRASESRLPCRNGNNTSRSVDPFRCNLRTCT